MASNPNGTTSPDGGGGVPGLGSTGTRSTRKPPFSGMASSTQDAKSIGKPQFAKAPKFIYTPRRDGPARTAAAAAAQGLNKQPSFSSAIRPASGSSAGIGLSFSKGLNSSSDVEDVEDENNVTAATTPPLRPQTQRHSASDLISDAINTADEDDERKGPESRKRRRPAVEKSFDFDDDIEDLADEEMAEADEDVDEIETDEDEHDDGSSSGNDLVVSKQRARRKKKKGGEEEEETTPKADAGGFKTPAKPSLFHASSSSSKSNKNRSASSKTSFPQFSTPLSLAPQQQQQQRGRPTPLSAGAVSSTAASSMQLPGSSLKPLINFLATPKFFKLPEQGSPYEGGGSSTTGGSSSGPGSVVAPGFISNLNPNVYMPPTDWSPSHRRHKSAAAKYKPKGLASTALRWAFDANDHVLRAGYVTSGGEEVGALEVLDVKRMDTYLAVRGRSLGEGTWWKETETTIERPPKAPLFQRAKEGAERQGEPSVIEEEDESMQIDGESDGDENADVSDRIVNVLLVNDLKTRWTNRIGPRVKVLIGEPYWITDLDGMKWTFAINWDIKETVST